MKRPSVKLFLSSLLLAASLFVLTPASLHYGGYCIAQKHFLSDDEKIRIGVATLNNTDPVAVKVGNDVKYFKAVRYRDVDDFIRHNPNCCRISFERNYLDGPGPVSFLSRISGLYGGDVLINYTFRYLDEHGKEHSASRLGLVAMDNCGHVVEP